MDEFIGFCKLQLATGDYDAHIPFLKKLATGLPREEALWLGLLYMSYYNEASAWVAFSDDAIRRYQIAPPGTLPIEVQRRNLYGGRINRHLSDLLTRTPFATWLTCSCWDDLLSTIGDVYGNGRWASYTTSELILHLAELPFGPTSYEILDSSGPRRGLTALGLPVSEEGAEEVRKALGGNLPISVVESLLCDWAGMLKGTFYAGRNIDRQQGRILRVERALSLKLDRLWAVRREVYPNEALGELHGWEGIDGFRLRWYRDGRGVKAPWEDR